MSGQSYRLPEEPESRLSLALGALFALLLFLLMALAQMLGNVSPPEDQLDESLIAFTPPDIPEIEEEPPPPPEEEEPPPELEQEPPQLTLDQLDIALNPGTGGALMGDFAMPTIATSQTALGTEDFVDFSELDQVPRPIGEQLRIPSRLKREPVSGRVVLLLKLDEDGRVVEVQLDSSNLPDFNEVVLSQVRRWKFTPPTKQGQPVKAKARLPFPIRIQ